MNTTASRTTMVRLLSFVVAAFMVLCLWSFPGCNTASQPDIEQGKVLAQQYCQSCHLLPDPALLSKKAWDEGVFPRMGPFLGINADGDRPYRRAKDIDPSFFPSHPLVTVAEWKLIMHYYLTLSPEVLPAPQRPVPIQKGLPFFEIISPGTALNAKINMATYLHIDTLASPHYVQIFQAFTNQLYLLDKDLKIISQHTTEDPVVDVFSDAQEALVCSIGKVMTASNLKQGRITRWRNNSPVEQTLLFDTLARPVQITAADLNADGKKDYLLCEFGNLTGGLSWMENTSAQSFVKHVLRAAPGAVKAIVQDVNHDGLPDVWALFAQGDEGIYLFTNKGHGQFESEVVLRFPPAYGSTSFELADFNKDGFPDIVYTCGDNGDATQILKPYHGVYIFINDGHNHFTQKYFYPVNGCYKVIAKDFDGDRDLDLATISFFPDAHQPEEAFLYFEQKAPLSFQPYALPAGTPFPKGLTMDAADLDGDGRADLVIGNGYFQRDTSAGKKAPLLLLLKNKFPRK